MTRTPVPDRSQPTSSRVNFVGKSGQRYSFRAWPLGSNVDAMGGGIYFITARECLDRTFPTRASHRCLAIGHTEDLAGAALKKSDRTKLVARGANCICMYPVASEALRIAIEKDLIEGNDHWSGSLVHLVHTAVPPRPPGIQSTPA